MGLVLFVFWFSRRFLENQKNLRESHNYKRQPKTTKQTFGKTKTTNCLKVSDPPLDMGLFVFLLFLLGFPGSCFWFCKRPSGKPTTNKTNPISKGGSETFNNFVFWVFPKVVLVFFGFFLYCWLSLMFVWFYKNLRENNTKHK